MPAPSAHNPALLTKMKRIFREMYNLNKDPHPDVKFFPSKDDPSFWNVLLRGPEATPYEGFVFHLYVEFPAEYPL